MYKFYFILIVLFKITSSQNVITVYIDAKNTKVTQFEKNLVVKLFKLKELKEKKSYHIQFIEMKSFTDAFKFLKENELNDLKHTSLAINEISYTLKRDEQYDFSQPYMFNKYTIMALKSRIDLHKYNGFNTKYKYGVVKGSVFDDKLHILNKEKNIHYIAFDNAHNIFNALNNNEIDFMYSDFIDGWGFNLTPIFFDGNNLDKFCIMFPEGSNLVNEVNLYIDYMKGSADFFHTIKSYFGADAVNFFKKSTIDIKLKSNL